MTIQFYAERTVLSQNSIKNEIDVFFPENLRVKSIMSTTTTETNLTKFPSDVLGEIFKYLSPRNLKSLSETSSSLNKITTKEIEKLEREKFRGLSYLTRDKFTLRLLEEMFKEKDRVIYTKGFDPAKASILYGYNFSETTENYKIYYVCDRYRKNYIKSVHRALPFDYSINICHSFNKIPKDDQKVLVISELDNSNGLFVNYLFVEMYKFSTKHPLGYITGDVMKTGIMPQEIYIKLYDGEIILLGVHNWVNCSSQSLNSEETVVVIGKKLAKKYCDGIKSKIPAMSPSAFKASREHGFSAKVIYVDFTNAHLVGKVDALICSHDDNMKGLYSKVVLHLARHNNNLKICNVFY